MDTLDLKTNKRGLRHYFKTCLNIKGRLPRSIYWRYQLYLICFIAVSGFITIKSGTTILNLSATTSMIIMFLLCFLYMALNCCLTLQRLHDTGRSGWWILLTFLPFIDIVLFIFCLLKSQEKDNRYGKYQKDEGNYIIPLFLTIALVILIAAALENIQASIP